MFIYFWHSNSEQLWTLFVLTPELLQTFISNFPSALSNFQTVEMDLRQPTPESFAGSGCHDFAVTPTARSDWRYHQQPSYRRRGDARSHGALPAGARSAAAAGLHCAQRSSSELSRESLADPLRKSFWAYRSLHWAQPRKISGYAQKRLSERVRCLLSAVEYFF